MLASHVLQINKRDAAHICRDFRSADPQDRDAALEALSDLGWLEPNFATVVPPHGAIWTVNPLAHERFARIGEDHARRRAAVREILTVGSDDD